VWNFESDVDEIWKREELVVAPFCKLGGNAATVDFFDWSMIWCFHPSQSTEIRFHHQLTHSP